MTTAIALELVHLRALAKSGRAAALKALRQRRGASPIPVASRRSQSQTAVTELDTGAGREDETAFRVR